MIEAFIICLVISANEAKYRKIFEQCVLDSTTDILRTYDDRFYVKMLRSHEHEDGSKSDVNVTYCLHPTGPVGKITEPTSFDCSRCMSPEEMQRNEEALKMISWAVFAWAIFMMLLCTVCAFLKRDNLLKQSKE